MDLILANRALVDHRAPPGGAGDPAPATGGLVEAVRPVLVPWDGATGTTWIGAGRGPHDRAWTDEIKEDFLNWFDSLPNKPIISKEEMKKRL